MTLILRCSDECRCADYSPIRNGGPKRVAMCSVDSNSSRSTWLVHVGCT